MWKENAEVQSMYPCSKQMGQKMFKPCQYTPELLTHLLYVENLCTDRGELIPGGNRPLKY